ncbi:hypothetical protein F443_04403 [Phytophthora nicotianae P1569]|uniref:RxLR effector protein n=1 Tax=Phytophthora nicotianae P1569 TaxID=1317065 RepID=V9FN00_PHYNI|nr:hypothetical protein F443_04403 [Phytophthora nicotianae P1569]
MAQGTTWPQKWRNKKVSEDDFSQKTIEKMLESERVQRKMFKRWNSYRMEDIKMKIGESKLNNDDVGVLPPKPPSLLTTLEKCQLLLF